MVTFRSCDLKLQTVAVLWTLFGVQEIPSQNCKPWQFYGHGTPKCGNTWKVKKITSEINLAKENARLKMLNT